MIDEYNLVEGDEEFIDGSMDLGTESPLEMNEHKIVKKMNESQFRNLVYEITLKMLDEELNEDDPAAAGAAPMQPAPGAPMDPMAPGGAMPAAPAEDADTQGLPGKYATKAKEFTKQLAQKVGDNTGGAPGFNPKGSDDEQKKQLAKQIAESVLRQIKEQYSKKK